MSSSVIRLSKKSEYAVRALLHMAAAPTGKVHSLHELCAAENLPVKFVEQALGSLKNAGILTSRRGSRGGYVLVRSPEGIQIGEVLALLEGPVGVKTANPETATRSQRALEKLLWQVGNDLEERLHERTLSDVLRLVPVSAEPDFVI